MPYQHDWAPIYFLIENKQPPSLAFLLMNFSSAILALVIVNVIYRDHPRFFLGKILGLLGQTPLFFYLAHLPIYSLFISNLIPMTFLNSFNTGRAIIEWILGLLILIPLCEWYRHLKRSYPDSPLQFI